MDTITIDNNDRVYLNLPDAAYKSKRQIGYLKERTFHTFRNPDKHTYKKTNSLGLNYKLLSQCGEYFDFIQIEYGLNTILETSREYFLKYGEFLHFKNNGLEKQIFLRLELFGMDKVLEDKKSKPDNKNKEIRKSGNNSNGFQANLFDIC